MGPEKSECGFWFEGGGLGVVVLGWWFWGESVLNPVASTIGINESVCGMLSCRVGGGWQDADCNREGAVGSEARGTLRDFGGALAGHQ